MSDTQESKIEGLKQALKTVLENPDKVSRARVAYHISLRFPVTPPVQVEADWYKEIIKHLDNE
jgi:hypothetical protein